MPTMYYRSGVYSDNGNMDFSLLREVYVIATCTTFRTSTPVGFKECLARVPTDMGHGDIVTCWHTSTDGDSIPCPGGNFQDFEAHAARGLYGRVVDLDSYVVAELNCTEPRPRM